MRCGATVLPMPTAPTDNLALKDWPHSPPHRLSKAGTFIVTAGTYQKQLFFNTPHRLTRLSNLLLQMVAKASAYTWCSAGWFERKADRAFFRTVNSFPVDRVIVPDEFEVTLTP